ncbi:DNL zinc finger-domain-containing protein [Crucibulum laeve]|uniref:DNL zinc finger-domain-containing protein n=1 Tax=Crucibulum laeve TaxID=68775 RepID=A0A5C3M402_9AGAR|nr:DNL zinc finger-domain-containing protein [Crucibulum laeve]
MLPSRLFRNTGLPPPLRSLISPHPSLPANVSVQLRMRLGVLPGTLRVNSLSAPSRLSSSTASTSTSSASASAPPGVSSPRRALEKDEPTTTASQPLPNPVEPRLAMTFTCTADGCSHRSTHQFTKRAYEKGIVLVECPGCKNRHLIADHLGWFKDSTGEGKHPTVEDILRARGETIKKGRGRIAENGDVEIFE